MDLGLSGRIALVTGASAGLGLASARALAAEGAIVAVTSRSAGRAAAAAADVGSGARGFACDATDPAARRALVGQVEAELGPVDILVVNSGGPDAGRFESHTESAFTAVLDEHLGLFVALAQAVLPGMRARNWGRIVAITSCAVKQPPEDMVLSNLARAAVGATARTLANEAAADGITVNSLLPGYTLTSRVHELAGQIAERRGSSAEEVLAGWQAAIPAARLCRPEEFAAVLAFICSTQAAYVNGVSLPVDGGWSRSLF